MEDTERLYSDWKVKRFVEYFLHRDYWPPSLQIHAKNTVQVGDVANEVGGPIDGHHM